MARNKSILNLKSKCKPDPLVATRQLENGRWQAAIMFPGAIEALVFDRPTERGLENEIIHQCRKRNYLGYKTWDTLQAMWDEKREPFLKEWQAMTCPDCEGKGSCPFCSSTGKVYKRRSE